MTEKDSEIKDNLKSIEQTQKKTDELLKRIIPQNLDELVVSEKFVVEEVVSKSKRHFINAEKNSFVGMFGSDIANYQEKESGYGSVIQLKVRSYEKDSPVKILEFLGNSIVQAGNYIEAKIPRYEEKNRGTRFPEIPNEIEKFYFDRPFKEKESAIEIAIMTGEKVLRRDQSIDYDKFQKAKENLS